MMRPFRSLLGRKTPASETAPAPTPERAGPRPERLVYLVGDIHGRGDLLELMLELIDGHIGGTGISDPRLVFLGDYIDHGPASRDVLERLKELTLDFPDNVTCLMGCHERMLLDFLSDPALRGPRWLRNGGAATLASYGVAAPDLDPGSPPAAFQDLATRLAAKLGADTQEWLAERPLSWSSGTLWAVHAGADPQRPMREQSARVLTWGHPEFDNTERGDGVWVAHGHIEQEAPSLRAGRIGLDTAAWKTDRLSGCAIKPDGSFDFLQT